MTSHRFISRAVLGAALLAIVPFGATTPASARTAPPDPADASAVIHAAGPERTGLRADQRPSSGKNLAAGPQFKKDDKMWRVIAPEVILRNTVSDPDGDKANLTFQVYTAKPDGTPDKPVKLTDDNQWGVLVSPYVASGKTAQVQVDYGRLKPGINYLFRTNAYDGSLYEQGWSAWEPFHILPYLSFPAPQASSTVDETTQQNTTFTRTDPGPALPTLRADGTIAEQPTRKRSCGAPDAQGHRLCIELNPPKQTTRLKAAPHRPAAAPKAELVDWCYGAPTGQDYMNRQEACLKSIGTGKLIFTDTDPDKPAIGYANFEFEQRIKAYPTKSESGSDFAEFDQQIRVKPTYIDPQLQGVHMDWKVASSCNDQCIQTPTKWVDDNNNYTGSKAYWLPGTPTQYDPLWGNVQIRWVGTGKQRIDLGWSVTASVDAGGNDATADFGTSGIQQVRELAPRCDDLVGGTAPGCTLPYFKPTFTLDTNLYPAAGAYYWLMQERMPDHAGARRWDSLLHYLGPDTTAKGPDGKPWTSKKSRDIVCDDTWSLHPTDNAVGSMDCDEYAMASTHESGGFPGGVNQVSSGSACAQLYTDRYLTDTVEFGLFADIRTAKNGPSGKERCGRAGISSKQNQGAFHDLPVKNWRLLDGDGYFVTNPGYEHCKGVAQICVWRKIS
ncbi:hypothetical protein [Streptomyces sp. NPDC046759]|uniref:hypothetical protein n=1 Tax=Streptomyces sp. NPDC046759 TaxID=3155019 RepID=UPI0033EBBE3C